MRERDRVGERKVLLAAGVLGTVLVLALYVALRVWPFGDASLLTGDFNAQYLHYFAHFRAALREGEGLSYAMEKSLGGSMLGILAYYCSSPLNIAFLLFDPVHYDVVLSGLYLVKTVLACVFMTFFLLRRFEGISYRAVWAGIGYAFCGYFVVYLQNLMWMDVVLLLPLVCWGVWTLVTKGRPFAFTVFLGLAIFANFYIAYMVCLFCVIYFLFEMLLAQPTQGKGRFWLRRAGVFAGGALLAGGLAAALWLPALADIFVSKGMSSGTSLTFSTEFSLSEFWRRLAPGAFEWKTDILVSGEKMTALPNVYCGIAAVVLTVVFAAAKGVPRRAKALGLVVLGLLGLSLYSTDLMLLCHALVRPVWFYWRNSFLLSFWLLFLAAYALQKTGPLSGVRFGVCAGVLALWLGLCLPHTAGMYTLKRWLLTVVIAAAILVGVWRLLRTPQGRRRALLTLALTGLTAAELLFNAYGSLRQFESYPHSEYQTFITQGQGAVQAAVKADAGAYRIEKTYYRSLNDAMSLGYYGISHFGSTQDNESVDLLHALGYTASSAALYSADNTLFADSFLGIRYLITKDGVLPNGYEATDTTEGLILGRNDTALPLLFAVSDRLLFVSLEAAEEPYALQNRIWQGMTGTDTEVVTANGGTDREALAAFAGRARAAVKGDVLRRASLSADLTLETDSLILITVPYSENIVVTADGEPCEVQRLLGTLCGVRLTAGTHAMCVSYRTPLLVPGLLVSAVSLLLLLGWALRAKRAVCKKQEKA